MKYLVVSDIHGVSAGAEAVLSAYEKHRPDAVLCLGDVLYHGPRNGVPGGYDPVLVMEKLNPLWHDIICVRGNCDAEVDDMVLRFPVMGLYNILLLGRRRIVMSHGHIYGPQNHPDMMPGDVFLSGHTHVPTADAVDGVYLLNPGSVSLPKGGHPCTYAVLDEEGFTVFTAEHEEYMHIDFQGENQAE
ncbi:MAG: phosphodiesterase [Solobacterium sp.]|nr:phosphodiesterase [Solobacterium sp.]MBR0478276.1 phosphodiesterase [Solobacterium sp.]